MNNERVRICPLSDGWDLYHDGNGTPIIGKEGFPSYPVTVKNKRRLEYSHAVQDWLDAPGYKLKPELDAANRAIKLWNKIK